MCRMESNPDPHREERCILAIRLWQGGTQRHCRSSLVVVAESREDSCNHNRRF
eukprot:gene5373-7123_t